MDDNTKNLIQNHIDSNEVCLFMKGTPDAPQCGFSMAVSNMLKILEVNFQGVNVLEDQNLREGIKVYSDWPTIPQLYINKEFVGGCDIVKEMYESGELAKLLERRLDAVIYRAKFATTVFSTRQLINHGHVRVNGKKVNISSYVVQEEDSIEIRDKSKQLAIIDIALANKERETPEYIQMDEKNKKVKFVRTPKFEEVPYPIVMEPNLVIEYYSR